jgi:predicted MFS family arabinose efflux permease
MLDLGLLRVPSFGGGLVAALAINGTLFSLLTYLILYYGQFLRLSPVPAGVSLLPLTVAIFFASGFAGRISRDPRRALGGASLMTVLRSMARERR